MTNKLGQAGSSLQVPQTQAIVFRRCHCLVKSIDLNVANTVVGMGCDALTFISMRTPNE